MEPAIVTARCPLSAVERRERGPESVQVNWRIHEAAETERDAPCERLGPEISGVPGTEKKGIA